MRFRLSTLHLLKILLNLLFVHICVLDLNPLNLIFLDLKLLFDVLADRSVVEYQKDNIYFSNWIPQKQNHKHVACFHIMNMELVLSKNKKLNWNWMVIVTKLWSSIKAWDDGGGDELRKNIEECLYVNPEALQWFFFFVFFYRWFYLVFIIF